MLAALARVSTLRLFRTGWLSSHICGVASNESISVQAIIVIFKDALCRASIIENDVAQVDIAQLSRAVIVVEQSLPAVIHET